jgi:hypothetical protein
MELDFARWIARRGGRFKLRDLARTRYIYEYRKLLVYLRRRGYAVDLKQVRRRPGSNLYTVTPPGGVWSLPAREKRGPGRPTREEVRVRREPLLPGFGPLGV